MLPARRLPCALFLLLPLLVPTFALAQDNPERPPPTAAPLAQDASLGAPKEGSAVAEVSMALLGELLSMGVTAAIALPAVDITDDYGEDDGQAPMIRAVGLSLIPRPIIVGGFATLGGRLSHGEGRAGFAMLGAVPGSLMVGASWALNSKGFGGSSTALNVCGHLASIGGSVAAYRYSARARMSPRLEHALRYTPSPMVDRQRGVAGLSLSGSF